MFCPVGKKKALLQIKRALDAGRTPPDINKLLETGAKSSKGSNSSEFGSPKRNASKVNEESRVSTRYNLEKLLAEDGLIGIVMNKILESTIRYHPERDSHVLKAFQSKSIEYPIFRHYLSSIFWLSFDDDEYDCLVSLYDSGNSGVINGYDFMISFIMLSTIRKEKEVAVVKYKQNEYEETEKAKMERKALELEKKQKSAADFDFSVEDKHRMTRRINDAAKKYDPSHAGSVALTSFECAYLAPLDFYNALKRTFNLRLSPKELGALIRSLEETRGDDIHCSEFIRYFLKLGSELREKARLDYKKKMDALKKNEEALEKQRLEDEEKQRMLQADFDFSPADEARTEEKVREAAIKFDRSAPGVPSLVGFDAELLSAGEFKDLVRRVFNLNLTNKELGVLVKKYDKQKCGKIHSASFLQPFLRLGMEERHRNYLSQLSKQHRKAKQEQLAHVQKMEEIQQGTTSRFQINYDFQDSDMESALSKLKEASTKYDASKQPSLPSFDVANLTPIEFKRALAASFGLQVTGAELGALVCTFDKEGSGKINCHQFLVSFFSLGYGERNKHRLEQLQACRSAEKSMKEAHLMKLKSLEDKVEAQIDFDFTNSDRESALVKMTEAASKYDKTHPSALGLDGFEAKSLAPAVFKDLIRRCFQLRLTPKETGALIKQFSNSSSSTSSSSTPADLLAVNSQEFLSTFIQIGITERQKRQSESIMRQRLENEQRSKEQEKKLNDRLQGKDKKFVLDKNFSEKDIESIMEKLTASSARFDRYHPSAPSLSAFDVKFMSPAVFQENLRSVFHVHATSKEIGYLLTLFAYNQQELLACGPFLTQFFAWGKERRDLQHSQQLEKQREKIRDHEKDEEERRLANIKRLEEKVSLDYNEFDLEQAIVKLKKAASRYDKFHPSAPNIEGFQRGPLTPGVFRELMKNTFRVHLSPAETGALVQEFAPYQGAISGNASGSGKEEALEGLKGADSSKNNTSSTLAVTEVKEDTKVSQVEATGSTPTVSSKEAVIYLDPNVFMVKFTRLGVEERNREKIHRLMKQKELLETEKLNALRKKKILEQKATLAVDSTYTDADRRSALEKLQQASALFDKNAPGCPSLTIFDRKYLLAGEFREVAKSTFKVQFTPKELSAILHEYDDGDGHLLCSSFLVDFIKMGQEARSAFRLQQLEKQREANKRQEKMEKIRKDGSVLDVPVAALERRLFAVEINGTFDASLVSWNYSVTDKENAFQKLIVAAKGYDRTMPSSLSLQGFEVSFLCPSEFLSLAKQIWRLSFTPLEFGAILDFFNEDIELPSTNSKAPKDEKDRMDEAFPRRYLIPCKKFLNHFLATGVSERAKEHNLSLKKRIMNEKERKKEEEDRLRYQWERLESKVTFDFSPEDEESVRKKLEHAAFCFDPSQDVTAFEAKFLSPAVFREMLKRVFGMKVSDGELAALIHQYDPSGTKNIDCAEFLKNFKILGVEKRRESLIGQLAKNKQDEAQLKREMIKKKEEADSKYKDIVDYSYSKSHFNSAMAKVRQLAGNYDPSHPSAPSLQGFMGGGHMLPYEFKDMMYRTFHTNLSAKELGALVHFFDNDGNGRIDNQEFITHFFKLQRVEQSKRRKDKIVAQREVLEQQKEEKEKVLRSKFAEDCQRLEFGEQDEESFLKKMRKAAQNYAVDSAMYSESLLGFKGPALTAAVFRDAFSRIFGVRLSFPEMGVFLKCLGFDRSGLSIDGLRFLNAFYKLARMEEKIMLGEMADEITLASFSDKATTIGSKKDNNSTTMDASEYSLPSHIKKKYQVNVGTNQGSGDNRDQYSNSSKSNQDAESSLVKQLSWLNDTNEEEKGDKSRMKWMTENNNSNNNNNNSKSSKNIHNDRSWSPSQSSKRNPTTKGKHGVESSSIVVPGLASPSSPGKYDFFEDGADLAALMKSTTLDSNKEKDASQDDNAVDMNAKHQLQPTGKMMVQDKKRPSVSAEAIQRPSTEKRRNMHRNGSPEKSTDGKRFAATSEGIVGRRSLDSKNSTRRPNPATKSSSSSMSLLSGASFSGGITNAFMPSLPVAMANEAAATAALATSSTTIDPGALNSSLQEYQQNSLMIEFFKDHNLPKGSIGELLWKVKEKEQHKRNKLHGSSTSDRSPKALGKLKPLKINQSLMVAPPLLAPFSGALNSA